MEWRGALKSIICLILVSVLLTQHAFAGVIGGLKRRREFTRFRRVVINNHFYKTRVIVKFKDTLNIRVRGGQLSARSNTNLASFEALTNQIPGVRVKRLFRRSENELSRERDNAEQRLGVEVADPNLFFVLILPGTVSESEVSQFVESLNMLKIVETAYLQPRVRNQSLDIPPQTPDYQVKQTYLGNTPDGMNWKTVFANRASYPGISGANVTVVDIEYNWNLNHEDLNPPVFIDGILPSAGDQDDHGTAVLGIMVAQDNGYGITGIVPDAAYGVVTTNTRSAASAINSAVSHLSAGDVINLSIAFNDDRGYAVPLEYYAAEFTAIQLAVAKGIIVVECAANGMQDGGVGDNLDDTYYNGIFNRVVRDSGAIMVGAAEMGALKHRYASLFSNYGSRIDSFAWGNNVATTGYGDLFHADANQTYMASGWGTSFSTPMVAGVTAAIESYYRQLTGNVLTPWQMRALLTTTGTPASNSSHYIGTMPDLLAALYRIQNTTAQISDTDHDGLLDSDEVALRTNPDLADSDGDGLADGDEIRFYHSDPDVAGAIFITPRDSGYNTLTTQQFQWVDVPGEDKYQLYLYDLATGATLLNTLLLEANNCSSGECRYTSTFNLEDGHRYIAWLYTYPKGSIAGGWSPLSDFYTWTKLPTVPVIQAPVDAATVSWKPTYSWTPQPGATGYQVMVSDGTYFRTNSYTYITPAEAGCDSGQAICSYSLTKYNNSNSTGLEQGTHTWSVIARNPVGTTKSALSLSMNVTLATPATVNPISPINSAITGSLPVFTWQAAPQANYYWLDVVDGTGSDSGYIYVGADLAGCANGEASCEWQPKGYTAANLPLAAGGISQWCVWSSNLAGNAPSRCANFVVQ